MSFATQVCSCSEAPIEECLPENFFQKKIGRPGEGPRWLGDHPNHKNTKQDRPPSPEGCSPWSSSQVRATVLATAVLLHGHLGALACLSTEGTDRFPEEAQVAVRHRVEQAALGESAEARSLNTAFKEVRRVAQGSFGNASDGMSRFHQRSQNRLHQMEDE